MRSIWMKASLMVAGSLLVYCAQDMGNGYFGPDGGTSGSRDANGPVSRADAAGGGDPCTPCPAPAPTTIFDGAPTLILDKALNVITTEAFDISAYRTTVIHLDAIAYSDFDRVEVWHGAAGWVPLQNIGGAHVPITVDSHLGRKVRLTQRSPSNTPPMITLVGYNN